jgi:hypothetical protein
MRLPPWLSDLANILEVLGFLLTIWVLVETYSIRRTFALRGRTPQLRRSLATAARALPPLLRAWPGTKNETLAILANARAVLENLHRKLPRKERTAVAQLLSDLRERRVGLFKRVPISDYTDQEMWKLFADLQGVIASLEQREKDATWE